MQDLPDAVTVFLEIGEQSIDAGMFRDLYGCERYVEMLHIINEAWKGNVDSYLAGVIRGVARFISVYEGEYSLERLVQQLARTHPKTITQLAQKDTGSSANRHMRQILRIYNGASREMSLPLKN